MFDFDDNLNGGSSLDFGFLGFPLNYHRFFSDSLDSMDASDSSELLKFFRFVAFPHFFSAIRHHPHPNRQPRSTVTDGMAGFCWTQHQPLPPLSVVAHPGSFAIQIVLLAVIGDSPPSI
eukprot:GEMP01090477.1.p1 GENE.GEMP01090477.1~~GEMP01090477.1.p1  ORF type:complete len:119 (-),score=14.73 GEMP01090477.1:337-693(-)